MIKMKTKLAQETLEELLSDIDIEVNAMRLAQQKGKVNPFTAALEIWIKKAELKNMAIRTAHQLDIHERTLQARTTVAVVAQGSKHNV